MWTLITRKNTIICPCTPTLIYYRADLINLLLFLPPATKLGQGNAFTGVCDSVNREGVCLSACWDTSPPPGNRHPPAQSMLGDTVNARVVRILLECNLVDFVLAPDQSDVQPHHPLYCAAFTICSHVTKFSLIFSPIKCFFMTTNIAVHT